MKLKIRNRPARAQRWFFATDVHGSDRCYRKFLAAARVYEADVLLLGGDVAGKAIVPIVGEGGQYQYVFQGAEHTVRDDGLAAARERISFNGFYPYMCDEGEREKLHDVVRRAEVFDELIAEQLRGWIKMTEERLDDSIPCIITPGNDDPDTVDQVLAVSDRIAFTERRVSQFGPVRLASLGNTNVTPWNTEREYDEETLCAQIDEMLTDETPAESGLVFNFHCPPFGTGLDTAVELDDDLRPVTRAGGVVEIPVGSTAVREAIERFQPTVGLHGHIHESRGVRRLGRSRCFNPGSDYASGVLAGLIVDFDQHGDYLDHIFTSG
jgi:Icc-related predicted phosphoesterase